MHIELLLINKSETGPKTARIAGQASIVVYCPKANLREIMSDNRFRQYFETPAVYCLKGSKEDDEIIYIGETKAMASRLPSHLRTKDFNEIIFFTTEQLNPAYIEYLESKLIQLAIEARTCRIDNDKSPRLSNLSAAQEDTAEQFLKEIKILFPLLNFNFLIPSTVRSINREELNFRSKEVYKIKAARLKATLYESEQGYIVTKGSEAEKDFKDGTPEHARRLRERLINMNILIADGEKYVFNENYIFKSPSAASNIVLGRSSNGLTEWVNAEGKAFGEIANQQV